MSITESLQGLFHQPYGLEHPYEQEPTERFPRNPVAGQPVALGVATWPPATAEAVWADWLVEGTDDGGQSLGTWVEDTGDRSYWRIHLPSFQPGRRVAYCLYARQNGRQLSSETFSFVVAGWTELGDVVDYQFATSHLTLTCSCDNQALHPQLVLTFHTADLLHLQWTAITPTDGSTQTETQISHTGKAYQVLEATEERIHLATGRLRLIIHRRPYRLEIVKPDGTPLLVEAQPPDWLMGEDERPLQMRQTFVSPAEEAFYGFGERFNALDQRGQKLDVRVFEQYKNQKLRTYIPIPFSLSSQNYGLYCVTNRYLAYDLAASDPEQWSFNAELSPTGTVAYYLIFQDNPQHIISAFTDLTGKPAMPPAWAFGLWMSGNEWNSQSKVMEQIHQTIHHRISATVLVIEAWSDEATFYIWNGARYKPRSGAVAFDYEDFTFAPDGPWPDPKGMVDELHRLGVRVLLWQIPVLKKMETPHIQHDADETHMLEKGYCVHEANNEPYKVRPFWFHDGLVLDVTNNEAVAWWLKKRAYLLDELGVDGFKTDGGEHIWGRDLRFADGRRGDELWNLYPNLYVEAYYRFANKKRNGNAITFSRAGFTGAQSFPCHWAGDENSTWEAFRASILAGLNAGLSGIPFWGWDLAGFSGEIPSAELYLRGTAMAAFCPIMQYHSEFNEHRQPSHDRTPWNIQACTGDPDVIPIFRRYTNLRMNLLPYIYSEAKKSSETGLPLMQALPLVFPTDGMARNFPYQYLFGESLLVAPVVTAGCRSQPVYLPEGVWYDFWTDDVHIGPVVIDYRTPKNLIPVFVKAGAILPLNLNELYELGGDVGNDIAHYQHLCFKIYPHRKSHYMWSDSITGTTYPLQCTVKPEEEMINVVLPALDYAPRLILKVSLPSTVTIDGIPLVQDASFAAWREGARQGWYYDKSSGYVFIKSAVTGAPQNIVLPDTVS